MDDLLECTKCGCEVDQILALQCEHNLCLPCSAKLYQRMQGQTLMCEICSAHTVLDPTAIQVLQDMYMNTSRVSNVRSSQQCHQSRVNQVGVTCQQHASEEAILYCYQCETPCFCMECYLQGLHKNHEVKNVSKTYNILKGTKGEQLYQKVKSSQETLLTDQCKLTNKKRELIDMSASVKMQIQNNFQEIYKALQQKENELIHVAEETMHDKTKEIDIEMHKVQQAMEKLNDILNDVSHYFPECPDQSQAIQAFNFVAQNNRKIDTITRQILNERDTWTPVLQINYILDPQSIIQQVEEIRNTKLMITSMRAIETAEPSHHERVFYEKAKEERTKRLFQLQTPLRVDENKENSFSLNKPDGLNDFERKFMEAKRTLSNRQKLN